MAETRTLNGAVDAPIAGPDHAGETGEWDIQEPEGEGASFAEAARSSLAALFGPAAVLVAVFTACLLFGGRTPSQEQPGESPSRSASPVSFSIPEVGARGILSPPGGESGYVPVARSAEAFRALQNHRGSGTRATAEQTGMVAPGTPVTFVKYDWGSYEVRLEDGPHAGERVWVAERFWGDK
jgi:hypothetical protein